MYGLFFSLIQILHFGIGAYSLLLILRFALSWFGALAYNTRPIRLVYRSTEPYLALFRSWIPPLGFLDLSAMIAFFGLQMLDMLLLSLLR